MPVQTRKRKAPTTKEVSPAKEVETAAVKKPAAAKKAKAATPSPQKPAAVAASAAAKGGKKAVSSGKQSSTPAAFKPVYNSVVAEINSIGPNVIKSATLSRHQPAISKKQDPKRAQIRKAISSEIRRLSAAEKSIKPTILKAKAQAESKRKAVGDSIVKKKVVQEINRLGKQGVQDLLLHKSTAAGVGKSAKRVFKGKSLLKVDPKKLSKKALSELEELVSPNAQHRPSLVKGKVQVMNAKKRVQAEIVKKATVKEIKRLGEAGVKTLGIKK